MVTILSFLKKNIRITLLVLAGFLVLVSIMWQFGYYRCINGICGVFFGSIYRAHDEVWHIALARTAFEKFPFQVPIFSGVNLSGYHFLFSYILFLFSKIKIPVFFSYFKLMPVIWFVLYTFFSIKLALKIKKSKLFVAVFIFFQYFAGSFSYFFRLYHFKDLWVRKVYFMHQPGQYLTNMPLAFSILLVLATLNLLFSKRDAKYYLFSSLIIFLSWGVKFYGGVVVFFLLFFKDLFLYLKKKLFFRNLVGSGLLYVLTSVAAVFLIFNPSLSTKTGGIFKIDILATVHSLIEEKDLLYLPNMALARYFLYSKGIGSRLIAIELFTLAAYLFFCFGTRVIGFFFLIVGMVKKKLEIYEMSISLTSIIAIIFAVTFVQKGDWFNTAQFFSYAMFLLNVFAAETLYFLFSKRKKILMLFGLIIIILTLHNAIDNFFEYLVKPQYVYISQSELDALGFLEKQPRGEIFSLPFDPKNVVRGTADLKPILLSASYDTSYIAAFTGKKLWLADQGQLSVIGVDFRKRLDEINNMKIDKIKARYFYLLKNHELYPSFMLRLKEKRFQSIFNNGSVEIFKGF